MKRCIFGSGNSEKKTCRYRANTDGEGQAFVPSSLYPGVDHSFMASTGFLWRFCKRHGLKELTIQGEKVSADTVSATTFVHEFQSIMEGYSLEQVFTVMKLVFTIVFCHKKTLASTFEKRADGRKKLKTELQ